MEKSEDSDRLALLLNGFFDLKGEFVLSEKSEGMIKEVLPAIKDTGTLFFIWEIIPLSLEKLIEARIEETLPGVADIEMLAFILQRTRENSDFERIIATKIEELLKEKLPVIKDMKRLMILWKIAALPDSETEKLIEVRMEELINQVSIDNVPEWFMDMLRTKSVLLPESLRESFRQKAEQLRSALQGADS